MPDFDVTMSVTVRIHVGDEDAIKRVIENHDSNGVPQPIGSGGWQDVLYRLGDQRDDVLGHLAYNCIANGVHDATRLDGWADLPEGTVTMRVDWTQGEDIDEVFEVAS